MELTESQENKLLKIGEHLHLLFIEDELNVRGVATLLSDKHKVDCVAVPNYNAEGRIYFGAIFSYFDNQFSVEYLQDEKYAKDFHLMGLGANKIFDKREEALSACIDYALDLVISKKKKNEPTT
jgi:hypothetical protein